MLGYYGNTESVFSLLVVSLIPIFFCAFILSFYKNKIIYKISSLAISFMYALRITAFIKNMSNLNFEGKLTTGKAVFYGVLSFVFLLFVLSFLMLSLSREIQMKATSLLKVISIISIVIFGLITLLFSLAIFILSDEADIRRFFIAFSTVFLLDVINYILMLVSVNSLNKTLYESDKKD